MTLDRDIGDLKKELRLKNSQVEDASTKLVEAEKTTS